MEGRQALGFATPALVGLALFTIVPVGLSIVMSFFDWPTFGERTFNGGANFLRLFKDPNFLPALRNTLVFTVLYVPINVVLSLALAIGLGPRIRGRAALRVLFFIPVVTPMVANVLVWKMLLQPQGLFNGIAITWFGIELPNFLADKSWAMIMVVAMSVWQGIGYNMLIFLAALQAIPGDLYEAARIDGATGFKITTRIKIPLVRGAALLAVLLSIVGTIQLFNEPTVIKSLASWMPENYTPMMMAYGSMFGKVTPAGAGPASAVSIMMALVAGVLAIFYALAQRKAD